MLRNPVALLLPCLCLLLTPSARADIVTDWNVRAGDIVAAAKLPAPPSVRILAIVQASVYEAVNAATGRYRTTRVQLDAIPGASVDAAVTAANHAALMALLPDQKAAIEEAYRAALAEIPDGPAASKGLALGEKAAAAILALRSDDGAAAPESYRPATTPGVYVPTVIPAVPQWPQRKPWNMSAPDQFRPGPPPALDSEVWVRDYNEIKLMGARNGSRRTPGQTEMAKFWETTSPTVYAPFARTVASMPGREITRNARLLAAAFEAMDDAVIAVFDAKYRYGFWRPVTAIRNGDRDGSDATERDPSWTPFIETPMHPEYPCAHCIVASALGAVLQAELGGEPAPKLSTTSPTAPGVTRSWDSIGDLVQEVGEARICDGVHYRNSTEVGAAMGAKIGALTAEKVLR